MNGELPIDGVAVFGFFEGVGLKTDTGVRLRVEPAFANGVFVFGFISGVDAGGGYRDIEIGVGQIIRCEIDGSLQVAEGTFGLCGGKLDGVGAGGFPVVSGYGGQEAESDQKDEDAHFIDV